MMKLYYGGQYMMRRSGRASPGSFGAMQSSMPAPDSVHVSEKQPVYAWTLDTWEKVAETRGTNQRRDMLAAIAELREEEAELRKQYRRTWGTPEWKRS